MAAGVGVVIGAGVGGVDVGVAVGAGVGVAAVVRMAVGAGADVGVAVAPHALVMSNEIVATDANASSARVVGILIARLGIDLSVRLHFTRIGQPYYYRVATFACQLCRALRL